MIANKKILFVCGALEYGKDGVGDYSRKVAYLLKKSLHYEVSLIAIHDLYIDNVIDTYEQGLRVIRISHLQNWSYKLKYLIDYCKVFQPDLISIQFVPFAFHPKGLPFKFPKILSKLSQKYKIHIMFHELWVGLAKEDSVKFKLWGYFQKKIIERIVKLKPPIILTTQSDFYQNVLEKISEKPVIRLPLLSNILINNKNNNKTINKDFNVIIFGSIQPGTDYKSFLIELKNVYTTYLNIIFLGRNGSLLTLWVNECETIGLNYQIIGEVSEEQLSKYFLLGSIGIITTPYVLFQKSGSAMAMFRANLHVVCVSRPWTPINFTINENILGLTLYKKGNLNEIRSRFDETYNFDEIIIENMLLDFYKSQLV